MGKLFKFVSKKRKEKWVLSTKKVLEMNRIGDIHIEINGNRELIVEGSVGVYEYKNDFIKLHIKNGYISVAGVNLDILNYGENTITISGKISSIEFA